MAAYSFYIVSLIEFLTNHNNWQVNAPLIVFASAEMHESNRVMHQFGFWQSILLSPQDIKELHKVDLWGRTDKSWTKCHDKYIYILEHRYDFIPLHEPILTLELTVSLDYITWFRHHNKSYLLLEEERTRQHRCRRPRRHRMNPRLGVHISIEWSSTPTPHVAPMVAPPSNQYDSYYSGAFTSFIFLYTITTLYTTIPCINTFVGVFFAPCPSPTSYEVPIPTTTPTYPPSPAIPTIYKQSDYATIYFRTW